MMTIVIFLLSILSIVVGGVISFREFSNRQRKIELRNGISYGRLKRGLIIAGGNLLLVGGLSLLIMYNTAPEVFAKHWTFMNYLATFTCCIFPVVIIGIAGTFVRLSVTEGRLED